MRSKLLVLSSLFLLLASCTPTYIVTFSGSTGGSVSNMGGEYDEGTTVSVSAQPETGYEFIGWSDGSSQNPRTISVSENLNLTALFGKQQFSVSVNTQGEGTVATSGATGQGSFEYGSSARFEAVPAVGWEFDSWSGDATGTVNPLSVTVEGPLTVTAIFKRQKFDLTVSVEGEGTVTEEVVVQPGQYDYETQVKLTAVPAEGWEFDSWSGEIESTVQSVIVTLDSAKQIKAIFKPKFFKINIEAPKSDLFEIILIEGLNDNSAQNIYSFGSRLKVTFKNDDGWIYKELKGDIESSSRSIELTLEGDLNINAIYIKATWITLQFDVKILEQFEDLGLSKGREFPLDAFKTPFVRKYPLEILDLESGERVWYEGNETQFLYSMLGNWSEFENNTQFLLPPGNYKITQPSFDPYNSNWGFKDWRGGFTLPLYIDQVFEVKDSGDKEQTIKIDAFVPDFALLTFDTDEFVLNNSWSWLGVTFFNSRNGRAGSNGFGPTPYALSNLSDEPFYHWYIGLDYLKKRELEIKIDMDRHIVDDDNRIISTTKVYYPLTNELTSRRHLHFKIESDPYGLPYVTSESIETDIVLRAASNNGGLYNVGFIKILPFDFFGGNTLFPFEVQGEQVERWDYRSFIPENITLEIYGPKNYSYVNREIKTPNDQIELDFVPFEENSNNYYRMYLRNWYIRDDNGFGFLQPLPISVSDRSQVIDFNNKFSNTTLTLFSVPDNNYDKIESYILWEDYNGLESFGDSSFRTDEDFIAIEHGDLSQNESFFFKFFTISPYNFNGVQTLFRGLYFKAYRNGNLVDEKKFLSSEYGLKPNFHYNYSLE